MPSLFGYVKMVHLAGAALSLTSVLSATALASPIVAAGRTGPTQPNAQP